MTRVSQNFAHIASNTLRTTSSKVLRMKSANEILAENLSRLMKAGGWNARTLAARAGVAPNTVGNYVKCIEGRSAKLSDVEKIAGALSVPLMALLTEAAASDQPVPELTQPKHQLLLDLDDLAPPRQSQFLDMIHQEAENIREAVKHHERKKAGQTTAAHARRELEASKTSTAPRREHPGQRQLLPLHVTKDPFNEKNASPKEKEWYERLKVAPKASFRIKKSKDARTK